jgi:hypothetical protein
MSWQVVAAERVLHLFLEQQIERLTQAEQQVLVRRADLLIQRIAVIAP